MSSERVTANASCEDSANVDLSRQEMTSSALRKHIARLAEQFAKKHNPPYYWSLGKDDPTLMFMPYEDDLKHGNFIQNSYTAILGNKEWQVRLHRTHQRRSALPLDRRSEAKELDSSNSSDALLMNVLCFPEVAGNPKLRALLRWRGNSLPSFGYPAKVPLADGRLDTTKVDLKLDAVYAESKLTEGDFTRISKSHMERYRDFRTVFQTDELPQDDEHFEHYQLLRNVLASYNSEFSFILIIDSRREDLRGFWIAVERCIKIPGLKWGIRGKMNAIPG